MYYKYDNNKLQYVKIKWIPIALKSLGVFIILLMTLGLNSRRNLAKDFTEAEILVITNKHNQFSTEKFINKLKSLNFNFPHIVYAQAKLETGNFKSSIFIQNNNLFGMKEAVKRINTAKGTQFQHAYYDTWMESLYDYALYSSRYLSSIKTESEYFEYLEQNYAEDNNYINKLKKIIEEEDLINKFNK